MSVLSVPSQQRVQAAALAAACGVALVGATACGVRIPERTEPGDESGATSAAVAPVRHTSSASTVPIMSLPKERTVYLVASPDDAEALREVLAGLWVVTGYGEVEVVRSAEDVARIMAEVAADDAIRWTRGLPPAKVYDVRPAA